MTLRARQLLQVGAILVAVGVVFAILSHQVFDRSYSVLNDAARTRAKANAQAISASVGFGMASRSAEDVRESLRDFVARNRETHAALVLDPKGTEYVSIGDTASARVLLGRVSVSKTTRSDVHGDLVYALAPIVVESAVAGHVLYVESLAAVLAYRRQVGWMALGAAVLLVLLIPAVGLLTFRRVMRALRQLSKATQTAQHDLTVRVAVRGDDELARLGTQFNHMLAEIDVSRRKAQEQDRLRREMEIAERVQTSLLPQKLPQNGLAIAARMIPATEVGGDYYDVLGKWISIGDVAGHGLSAGLVMMMAQSAIATATAQNPDARPSEILTLINRVIHENVRHRWHTSHHMTLTLLRHDGGGRFVYAGAHEDLLVWRAARNEVELLPTPGPWVGAIADISRVVQDSHVELALGDRLVLFTDGVVEAGEGSARFGLDRLCEVVKCGGARPELVIENVLNAVAPYSRHDDQTVLVVEYTGST